MVSAAPNTDCHVPADDEMLDRYRRAVERTAPKVSVHRPSLHLDGYWIDASRYFFLAEATDPGSGLVAVTPSVADMEKGAVIELITPTALNSIVSRHLDRSVGAAELLGAKFDLVDDRTLGVALAGWDLWIDTAQQQLLQASPTLAQEALYSPDGRFACFVRQYDLWLRDRGTGEERPLTDGGTERHCYGQETETCSWAISYRQRPRPMGLWSPDSQWILTHQIDERSLPTLDLVQNVPPNADRPVSHRYGCPFPGDDISHATYVAIHVATGRTFRFDTHPAAILGASPFARRSAWFDAANRAWVLRTDRYFQTVELLCIDLEQASIRPVLEETCASGYIELHQYGGGVPNVRVLPATDEIVWFSERDGWGHLYLYDAQTGAAKGRITQGDWLVRDLIAVDEERRRVLFTACGFDPAVDPARRVLLSADLDGGEIRVLRDGDGDVAVRRDDPQGSGQDRSFRRPSVQPGLSQDGRFAALIETHVGRGNSTMIVDLESGASLPIAAARPEGHEPAPLHVRALAADGRTPLYGVLFLPSDFDRSRRYPLIDCIYPGPQSAQQPQSFHAVNAGTAQALAELGFATLMLDTRGMPFRSRAIHQAGYGDLLGVQLSDHAAVVAELCGRHRFLDIERVGVVGFSGGGYAAARALLDYPDLFKVGVSICGNHDNRRYISFWSDKYCGRGARDKLTGRSSAEAAANLRGRLLLVSGDMDENVHVSQMLGLVDALIGAHRDFDMLIVPNEGHMLLWTSGYVQRRIWDYFVQHLLRAAPPRHFPVAFSAHEIARMMARRALETSW